MNKYIYIKMLLVAIALQFVGQTTSLASSHREAPLIANDPLADNTDLYAFRSPDNPDMITIIANYVPLQLPHGGPNYYQFGEDIRYEIHIDNNIDTPGDDIIYRFTFSQTNDDPTTFFNIRLGAQNLKTTYTMEKSTDGGDSFTTVIAGGVVPPPNVGDRSISSAVGLDASYADLMAGAISTTGAGESVFCGTADDPFYADLAGIFDLGDAPRQSGMSRDNLACLNVSSIAIQIPISLLQKDGQPVSMAANILDGDYVIGVWASASRQQIRTLAADGSTTSSGDWVQVSRLGMPLTNEAVIAIGDKDFWNSLSPYDEISETTLDGYFYNPELGLYMDDDQFGPAVPGLSDLRIQRNSLAFVDGFDFDFGNGQDGLFPLKNSAAVAGTALDDAIFGELLLPGAGQPRSVDLWPIFHTGVPNLEPYQLATGKTGNNPLTTGKPFINNFLPNGGDMLRLNMATPVTDRDSEDFSSLGLIQAAVLGLTDPTYTDNGTALEFIPNMDGFPNGRRLEDDVTRIELQAVGGAVLAAIGLWYDDYDGTGSPVTDDLVGVLSYTTGVEENDIAFQADFPYVQMPWSGTSDCSGMAIAYEQPNILPPSVFMEPCGPTMLVTGCGETLDPVSGSVKAQFLAQDGIACASNYIFRFTNVADPEDVVIGETGANYTRLFLNSLDLQAGATYSVAVATTQNDEDTAFGPECDVTIASIETELIDSHSDPNTRTLDDFIKINFVGVAEDYTFRFQEPETNDVLFYYSPGRNFTRVLLNQLPLSAGTYLVDVRVQFSANDDGQSGVTFSEPNFGDDPTAYGPAKTLIITGDEDDGFRAGAQGTDASPLSASGLSVYPNPLRVGSDITISGIAANSGIVNLTVFDAVGKVVQSKQITVIQGRFIQQLPLGYNIVPGLYNVVLQYDSKVESTKVLVK